MEKVQIDGQEYEIAHQFSNRRAAIRYEGGLVVMADLVWDDATGSSEWQLSGTPTSPEETKVVEALMPARDSTEVAVVSDAGTD